MCYITVFLLSNNTYLLNVNTAVLCRTVVPQSVCVNTAVCNTQILSLYIEVAHSLHILDAQFIEPTKRTVFNT
jgi:hypothetical protein